MLEKYKEGTRGLRACDFFSICILKGFEAPKTSPSTFSPDDGGSSVFRTTCLFLFISGKIVRRREFETVGRKKFEIYVDPNTRRVHFFSASIFP